MSKVIKTRNMKIVILLLSIYPNMSQLDKIGKIGKTKVEQGNKIETIVKEWKQ